MTKSQSILRQILFKAFSFISVMSAVIDSQAQVDH